MSTEDNIAVVRRFIDEVVNGGDMAALGDIWTEDMVWRGGSLGERHGLAEYKAFLAAGVTGSFTGMHLDVQRIFADGDTVVVMFTNSGTHTGEFLGMAATGRSAKWNGIGCYRVRDGKIAEGTFVEDMLDLLRQLGITTLAKAG